MLTAESLEKYSKYFDYDFTKQIKPVEKEYNQNKEVWIADVHAPYYHDKHYKTAINTDASILRILGDFFDMYSKSHFRKTEDIDFRAEFRQSYWLLADTCSQFEEVYIMLTNHDNRLEKWLYDNCNPEMLNFVNKYLVKDLLSLIPNLKIMEQQISKEKSLSHIAQIGNAIFTHVEKSSIIPGKVVQDIHKDLSSKWMGHFKLQPYNIMVQAHNHIYYEGYYGDTKLFQIPCLIDPFSVAFEYTRNGKLQGNPPALGYMTTEKDGKGFIQDKTKIIKL